jgi:hypothetical protein
MIGVITLKLGKLVVSVILFRVVTLSDDMLSVITLSVVILSVVAPMLMSQTLEAMFTMHKQYRECTPDSNLLGHGILTEGDGSVQLTSSLR